MLDYFRDIAGVVMTGLLGVLWFDLRTIRKEVKVQRDESLSEKEHVILCENSTLRLEKTIVNMRDEILLAIKKNNTN